MDKFDELKQKAEVQIEADKAAVKSWVTTHVGWLISVGLALLTGFILGKL